MDVDSLDGGSPGGGSPGFVGGGPPQLSEPQEPLLSDIKYI
jgi:hypothetical protein